MFNNLHLTDFNTSSSHSSGLAKSALDKKREISYLKLRSLSC